MELIAEAKFEDVDVTTNETRCIVRFCNGTIATYTEESDLQEVYQQLAKQFEMGKQKEYFEKETGHLGLGE
jgi:hypothetical protein